MRRNAVQIRLRHHLRFNGTHPRRHTCFGERHSDQAHQLRMLDPEFFGHSSDGSSRGDEVQIFVRSEDLRKLKSWRTETVAAAMIIRPVWIAEIDVTVREANGL